MILIIILVIVVILFFVFNSGNSKQNIISSTKNTFEAEIDVPNPENSNPKNVIEFIDHYDSNVVKPVYEQLNSLNKRIPPLIDSAFREKIQNHYISKEIYLWNMSIESRKIIEDDLEVYPSKIIFELKGLHLDKYVNKLKNNIIYDEVYLEEDPENEYDNEAIKVENLDGIIGYVPREQTFEIKEIIEKDYRAYINKIERQPNFLYAEIIIYYK